MPHRSTVPVVCAVCHAVSKVPARAFTARERRTCACGHALPLDAKGLDLALPLLAARDWEQPVFSETFAPTRRLGSAR